MKPTTKAALLSAFVFPGAGQLYVGRKRVGYLFIVLAALGLFAITALLMSLVNILMEQIIAGTMQPSIGDITQAMLAFADSPEGSNYAKAKWAVLAVWLASVLDAYIAARHYQPETEPSKKPLPQRSVSR